jgi:uncharacterized membrane protein YhhN
MMVVATIVCALACLVLVGAEWKRASRVRIASKTLASLAFILVGVAAGASGSYAMWIVIGLVLGAVGDVALLGKGERWFLGGLVAFLLGHLAYVVAIAQLAGPTSWVAPLAIAPLVIGGVALAWLWPRLGTMTVPVIVYVATIVTMVAGALAVWQTLLTTGAILFFVSDLAVARDRFVVAGVQNRAWGLPCYYAGQLLIAWSLAS